MNPCSNRDVTYSAGKLTAFAMYDWQQNWNGWMYSGQSGWMMLRGTCNGTGS